MQGVGFRPSVYRHAVQTRLTGFVRNTVSGVEVEAQGPRLFLDEFLRYLKTQSPRQAQMESVSVETILPVAGEEGFRIVASERSGDIVVGFPPDLATCGDCVRELFDPADRRYRYPFINCTNCGPRFTIVASLPYDRARTSMATFPLCQRCHEEYVEPDDRRFDAQPNACPACGPALKLLDASGREVQGADPLDKAVRLLRGGHIVAVKSLGGFHLCCDARSDRTVRELRARKGRADKPFAVMFADSGEAGRYCSTTPEEIMEMLSVSAPVVIVGRREGTDLSPRLAPDTRDLGVLLPYTPLHHLLLKGISPLVMTSGNLSEEPIIRDEADLSRVLGPVADYALVHNRPILRRCDDSVLRLARGRRLVYRRSRGWVPGSLPLRMDGPPVLAVGADLKNVFCITRGRGAFLSQHIGDLSEYPSVKFFEEAVTDLSSLLGVSPGVVAHDLHPDYASTRFALAHAAPRKIAVQHHHAHVASCMAEHGLEASVIGVALDGTGYGPDGTIWGGEFLVADYRGFRRAGHLEQFALPGGDEAIRHPARIALSLLHKVLGDAAAPVSETVLRGLPADDRHVLLQMIRAGTRAPLTSSAGRLFDAVSALLGLCDAISYEGQAAVRLQTLAVSGSSASYEHAVLESGEGLVLSFAPLVRRIVEELRGSPDRARIARGFHEALARGVADVCARIAAAEGIKAVALSGGVFQNELLLVLATDALKNAGLTVYSHHEVPPNDGGIALGQAAIALAALKGD